MTAGVVRVRDVMTRRVKVTQPNVSLMDAARRLQRFHISGLPVVDKHKTVVGVISEKDISRAISETVGGKDAGALADLFRLSSAAIGAGAGKKSQLGGLRPVIEDALMAVKVAEVMNHGPVVIDPDASIDSAARIMVERSINRLPVIENDLLVGIVTRHDVLSAWV